MLKTADGGWNPYFAGALVGLLAILSAYATTALLGKTSYLGASTTFVRAAGYIESSVAPEKVKENEYYTKEKVKVDWQFMLVLGIALGAAIAALSSKTFKVESTPPIWSDRFGPKIWVRAVGAFLGGIVLMFGARLANGCPSGHGLSGLMQMSLSGYVSLIMFFVGGIVVANLVYRRR
ncbi:MAG: YeeE/YedE thiosulfate transporter family protein [Planctomycetota bacterium]